MLSPTIELEQFLSAQEVDDLSDIIFNNAKISVDDGTQYPDDFTIGRNSGRLVSEWHDVDFYALPGLQDLLVPKLTQSFGYGLKIENLHILVSHIPYLLHTDVLSKRGLNPRSFPDHEPEYTILIPLEDNENRTILFNEFCDGSNNFEHFKKNYAGTPAIRIDKKTILENLTHLHPTDLKYLTLQKIFHWKKGSLLAVDRRYFHCSSNFQKHGTANKKCIVIRTARPITR